MLRSKAYKIIFCVLGTVLLTSCRLISITAKEDSSPQEDPILELEATVAALMSEGQPAQTPASEPLPFQGLWVSASDDPAQAGQILVLTPESFYQVQTFDPLAPDYPPAARETFAEIVSYDLENSQLTLRIQWLRTNGTWGGFDQPTALITYRLEDDVLQIGISRSGDGQFPVSTGPLQYHRR